MWYFPLLKEYVDHVPVEEDLSDLEDKIRWCRENDDKCREIAFNCKNIYDKYVAKSGLLDYLEMITHEVASRFTPAPSFWTAPTATIPPPAFRPPSCKCSGSSTMGGAGEEEVRERARSEATG